jgi:hypothetical protein
MFLAFGFALFAARAVMFVGQQLICEGSVMNTDVARTWDWIGSVLLFAFAILIILAFAFL